MAASLVLQAGFLDIGGGLLEDTLTGELMQGRLVKGSSGLRLLLGCPEEPSSCCDTRLGRCTGAFDSSESVDGRTTTLIVLVGSESKQA